MDQLRLGVVGRSRKENERRLAIHPLHVDRIAADLRERIYLERGYGEHFGVSDEQLAGSVAGLRTRAELFADCDVILLPKPQAADLEDMRAGQVLWGWPHCVQDEEITQLSIDRRLTLIAFEAMNYWAADGSFSLHVFHKNNEMAGYCSVLHALELAGVTGDIWPAAAGGRHQLRGDRAGRCDRSERARRERRRCADASCHQRGSLADPLRADRALRSGRR